MIDVTLGLLSTRWPFPNAIAANCYRTATRPLVSATDGIQFEFGFGSGTGIRTLNLAVNRSLHPVQKSRPEFAECH
jgi:hypothetical protein